MGGFGYVYALVLAAVFVRAAVAKLARRAETEASFGALGLPAARHAARVVPMVELALAVALIAAPRAGGIGSVVLLAAFTAVLVRAIRSGVSASCNCFGAARADPVSEVDVLRNGLLAGLAAGAAFTPAPTMPTATEAAAAVVLCGLGAGIVVAARR